MYNETMIEHRRTIIALFVLFGIPIEFILGYMFNYVMIVSLIIMAEILFILGSMGILNEEEWIIQEYG